MLEYFFNVRNRDIAHRQKFVVVATGLSFILIVGIWIPFQLMQLRSGANKATVAENKVEEASPSPVVAGDTVNRSNLPFLSGATVEPEASPSPTASTDSGIDAPLISDPSPEPASATPVASDFPTL